MDLFSNNTGLALIVSLDVDCKRAPVLLNRSRLEIRTSKKRVVMRGIIDGDKQTIKIERGEVASVKFIFNPSPYVEDLEELSHLFTGAIYSIELLDFKGKKVGKLDSRRIKEIRTITSRKIYNIVIHAVKEKQEAQRIMDVLKANDIARGKIEEKRIDVEPSAR